MTSFSWCLSWRDKGPWDSEETVKLMDFLVFFEWKGWALLARARHHAGVLYSSARAVHSSMLSQPGFAWQCFQCASFLTCSAHCSPWLSRVPSLASLSWTEVCRLASLVWTTAAFTVPVHNPSPCKHFCCGLQHLCSPISKPFAAKNKIWLRFCFHHSSQYFFALVSIVAKICFELIIWALNDWEKPPSCTVALQK